MKHFIQLGNVDILPLRLQLEKNQQLWNQHKGRRERDTSPHVETSDIWLRYRPEEELHNKEDYNGPFPLHVWYPAYYILNEVKPILQSIMTRIGGTALGGTIITKIPPGGQVKPHTDACSWHATNYDTKVYVTIKSNENCVNVTEEEPLVMRPGEVWTFDNLKMHAVYNNGDDDRITLMTAIRTS